MKQGGHQFGITSVTEVLFDLPINYSLITPPFNTKESELHRSTPNKQQTHKEYEDNILSDNMLEL
jgi:hypothetical protein